MSIPSALKDAIFKLKEELATSYQSFQEKIMEFVTIPPKQRIYVMFVGNPLEDGHSWCPDCRNFETMLSTVLPTVNPSGILLRVYVGVREEWKDPKNVFRTDPELHITSIPTLIEWGTTKRLSEKDAENEIKIANFFKN